MPSVVVTVRSTGPGPPTGEVAVSCVLDVTVTEAAAVRPNRTDEPPVKLLPRTVTAVPPAVVPVAGLTLVTVGPAKNDDDELDCPNTKTLG